MEYIVYIAASTCVLEVHVESDSPPQVETEGLKVGDSIFPKGNILGVVPKGAHKYWRSIGGPK
jgi:hypothetical protein